MWDICHGNWQPNPEIKGEHAQKTLPDVLQAICFPQFAAENGLNRSGEEEICFPNSPHLVTDLAGHQKEQASRYTASPFIFRTRQLGLPGQNQASGPRLCETFPLLIFAACLTHRL